jgi:acetylornithine/succinyldiaminopimelate/putrescine aminotransferase
MHGKSAMTASMCWDNAPIRVERVHTVPFVDTVHEDEILGRLSRLLATRRIAALFVEPIQGSNAGHEASTDFYHRAINLCQETGTYCVFDEILTGLYRTGTTFYADRLTVKPDFLLFAKCMGNGFPVSSLAIPQGMALAPAALPGSTFADNPLAAAAVAATLEAMCELDMPKRVAAIDRTVRDALDGREADGLTLRGKGALWLLELGGQIRVADTLAAIRESGVLVSCHGRNIRLLPAATIDLDLLHSACRKIADACLGNRA